MNSLPKILFIARDDGGCGFFRCRQPADFLRRIGKFETEVVQNVAKPEQLMSADLVILQEMGNENASGIARFCIEHKIPYVVEFDDFVHHVSPHNLGGYPAWNPSTLYIHRAMEMSRAAFAMQVSTPQLAREYFPYNPNIFVIPNFLDKDVWDNPIVRRNDGKIRVGWCGGNAHADDLHMISGVIKDIVEKYKGKVIFETMGMARQELAGVFPLQETKEACPSCGFEGSLHHYLGDSIRDYPLSLATKGWDIAVAPVINNAFGNCKSDLKIKEYAAANIPMIASPVVPYLEAAEQGASIVFAKTYEEWYTSLDRLIKKQALRDEIIKQNKEWIEKNWVQENVMMIAAVYTQLIKRAQLVLGPKSERT